MDRIRDIAEGRWGEILERLGVGPEYLKNRHGPCPVCGGKDRFRWDDKGGSGSYYCGGCGAGTGYKLALLVSGKEPRELNLDIRRILGGAAIGPRRERRIMPDRAQRILAESRPLTGQDPASRYLDVRGLPVPQVTPLRYHEAMTYWQDGKRTAEYPALVAPVEGPAGELRTVHVTYLHNDRKAPVDSPRKIVSAMGHGGCVRLMPRGLVLGIAEGIETALGAWSLFGLPTWAALNAGALESWEPVGPTREVVIYGDNDASHTGQAAAYSLAKRLRSRGIVANVAIPEREGEDWCDVATRRAIREPGEEG